MNSTHFFLLRIGGLSMIPLLLMFAGALALQVTSEKTIEYQRRAFNASTAELNAEGDSLIEVIKLHEKEKASMEKEIREVAKYFDALEAGISNIEEEIRSINRSLSNETWQGVIVAKQGEYVSKKPQNITDSTLNTLLSFADKGFGYKVGWSLSIGLGILNSEEAYRKEIIDSQQRGSAQVQKSIESMLSVSGEKTSKTQESFTSPMHSSPRNNSHEKNLQSVIDARAEFRYDLEMLMGIAKGFSISNKGIKEKLEELLIKYSPEKEKSPSKSNERAEAKGKKSSNNKVELSK